MNKIVMWPAILLIYFNFIETCEYSDWSTRILLFRNFVFWSFYLSVDVIFCPFWVSLVLALILPCRILFVICVCELSSPTKIIWNLAWDMEYSWVLHVFLVLFRSWDSVLCGGAWILVRTWAWSVPTLLGQFSRGGAHKYSLRTRFASLLVSARQTGSLFFCPRSSFCLSSDNFLFSWRHLNPWKLERISTKTYDSYLLSTIRPG